METKEAVRMEGGYGWVMVGLAFLLTALGFGVLGSVGVFLKPLSEEFGWSRGGISFGYTAVTLATGAAGVFWGILADRIGARIPAMIAAVAMGGALLMMSQVSAVWQFYALHFVFGALGHGALMGPMYANVGLWFSRNAGLAIGIATAGGAFGQGVVPAIARWLITSYGWDWAYAILGVGYIIIAFPLALMVRQAPSSGARTASAVPTMKDGSPFPLTPGATVAWISAAAIFCCACMAVPLVHLVPMLSDRGMEPQAAVTVLFTLMMAGAIGRLAGGKLADQIGASPAYMVVSFGQTVLVLGFPYVTGTFGIYVLAVAFGLFFSGVMSTFLVCVRMMVPSRMLAGAMSIALAFAWLGMGIGGWLGGMLFDLTGNYAWSYAAAALAGAINLALQIAFRLQLRRMRTAWSPAVQPAA